MRQQARRCVSVRERAFGANAGLVCRIPTDIRHLRGDQPQESKLPRSELGRSALLRNCADSLHPFLTTVPAMALRLVVQAADDLFSSVRVYLVRNWSSLTGRPSRPKAGPLNATDEDGETCLRSGSCSSDLRLARTSENLDGENRRSWSNHDRLEKKQFRSTS